jgi:hypothetical protein
MSEGPLPETSDAAVRNFIELIALGFVLEAVAALFRGESGLRVGGGFVAGAAVSLVGFQWRPIRNAMGARFGSIAAQIATDPRWWLGAIFLFAVVSAAPSTMRAIPQSARGIWFDRLMTAVVTLLIFSALPFLIEAGKSLWLRRRAAKRASRGYFDFQIDLQLDLKKLLNIVARFVTIQTFVTTQSIKRAAEFNAAKANPANISAHPAIQRRIASRAAADFSRAAARMERNARKFKIAVERFFETNRGYIQTAPITNAAETQPVRIAMQTFMGTVTAAKIAWNSQMQAAANLRGMLRDLNIALDRLLNAMGSVTAILDDAERGASGSITVLDQKISGQLAIPTK